MRKPCRQSLRKLSPFNKTIEHTFVYCAIIEAATRAVPSESLQGVRRVPMAKITALLIAASVLVLSIALLFLIAR